MTPDTPDNLATMQGAGVGHIAHQYHQGPFGARGVSSYRPSNLSLPAQEFKVLYVEFKSVSTVATFQADNAAGVERGILYIYRRFRGRQASGMMSNTKLYWAFECPGSRPVSMSKTSQSAYRPRYPEEANHLHSQRVQGDYTAPKGISSPTEPRISRLPHLSGWQVRLGRYHRASACSGYRLHKRWSRRVRQYNTGGIRWPAGEAISGAVQHSREGGGAGRQVTEPDISGRPSLGTRNRVPGPRFQSNDYGSNS